MNQKDALKLLAVLKAAYPKDYSFLNEEEAMGIANVWVRQFSDLPYQIVSMAVEKHISVEERPPTIAAIKKKISSVYWDAYEAIALHNSQPHLTDKALKLYQRILEVTQDYKFSKMAEPQISQLMINGSGMEAKMLE